MYICNDIISHWLLITQYASNTGIHLSLFICPPGQLKSNINSVLFFGLYSRGKYLAVNADIYCVTLLVLNLLCLQLGAEKVVHKSFFSAENFK